MEGMVHLYYAGVFGGPQNDARLLRGQDSWGIGLNLLGSVFRPMRAVSLKPPHGSQVVSKMFGTFIPADFGLPL